MNDRGEQQDGSWDRVTHWTGMHYTTPPGQVPQDPPAQMPGGRV